MNQVRYGTALLLNALVYGAVLLGVWAGAAFAEGLPLIKKECSICHVSHMGGMLLKEPLPELCIRCHPDRVEADHKVDIVPSMDVGGLPLDREGRITCTTCHDTHGTMGIAHMLRAKPEELCSICHKK